MYPSGGGDNWNGLEFIIESIVPDRLYHCDPTTRLIYELDLDTKLQISSVASPSGFPNGIGGTATRLYHCDSTSDLIYELDLDTKLQISSVASPSTAPTGVGGISTRLYHCDITTRLIYELDLNTKLQISSVASPSTNPTGVGGTKSPFQITQASYDSITYTLTDDCAFKSTEVI